MIASEVEWDKLAQELIDRPAPEGLRGGIELLEEQLERVKVCQSTLLRDVVAVDYAAQVLEAGKGIRTLSPSDAQRTAYAVARRAFESFHELLELLAGSDDAELKAAEAFVLTVFSVKDNQGLLDRAAQGMGLPVVDDESIPAREFVRRSAEEIGRFSPSGRAALERALALREKKGSKKRLDGARRERLSELARSEGAESMALMLQAYWGSLSFQAHPHVRLGSAVVITPTGVQVLLNPTDPDEAPDQVGLATTYSAARLCWKYLRPDRDGSTGG